MENIFVTYYKGKSKP